jgi:pyruvate,water dikinase
MHAGSQAAISTGHPRLDETLQGLRWGDNVVYLVERLADYAALAQRFIGRVVAEGRPAVYVRFAPHAALLTPQPGIEIVQVDPSAGFDLFSAQIHRLIERQGPRVSYAFDSLSALVDPWATDESVANFFRVTCPYLAELETIAYFCLDRERHANEVVARVAETTQLLIDLYREDARLIAHAIKVAGRYSARMFRPFPLDGGSARAEDAEPASGAAGRPGAAAPWNSVYERLAQVRGAPEAQTGPEVAALRAGLRRMLLGDEPTFAALADRYLTVDDLLAIRDRVIGTGRIGGKAAGMLLARRVLAGVAPGDGNARLPEALAEHDSFYIGSDVFYTFLVENGLFRRRLEVHRQEEELSHARYEALEAEFLAGTFPAATLEAFRAMLAHYGEAPIIVRSSSFLEDGFGHPFTGKYRSEFCPNQGTLEERLEGLLRAIKRVYASAVSPSALAYRRRHDLAEPDEQMAILVQRVSGDRYKRYHLPARAGVAFSRNIYPWAERIDSGRGLARLVFGLGTRAVDRVEDYPRMVALSHPELRPESDRQVAVYSQHRVDVIDLEANRLVSLPVAEVLADRDYPGLHLLVSEMREGFPYEPPMNYFHAPARDLVLTFNGLIRRTDLVPTLEAMLRHLERAYGHPVEIEFAANLEPGRRLSFDLLQCRPMPLPLPVPGWTAEILSAEIPAERVLFQSERMAGSGLVRDIRTIVYVDPRAYSALETEMQYALGRLVGRLNAHPRLQEGAVLMMGPGRWGSSNVALGVHVSYADIDATDVLVEVAREEAGQLPEVSYGTHFFQDLVEDDVIYVPVYPDDPASRYAEAFFCGAPSILEELLPAAAAYGEVLRVIDVARATGGMLAHVAADPTARRALCYLE